MFHSDHSLYFDVNLIPYRPSGRTDTALTSPQILKMVFDHVLQAGSHWYDLVGRIHRYCGAGTTVWGLKNEGGNFSLEFYFYYPRSYPRHVYENLVQMLGPYLEEPLEGSLPEDYECLSFDIAPGSRIRGLNVYRVAPVARPVPQPSITASSFFLDAKGRMERVNTYYSLLREPGFFSDGFHFSDSSCLIPDCCLAVFPDQSAPDRDFYQRYLGAAGQRLVPVGVAEKRGALGLYFMGLALDQLLDFLGEHCYPEQFLAAIVSRKRDLSHMKYDIGMDFSLRRGAPVVRKTAFFGTV